jgi:hypothetical protein
VNAIWLHGSALVGLFVVVAGLAPQLDVGDPRTQLQPWSVYAFVGFMLLAGAVWWSACLTVQVESKRAFVIVISMALLMRVAVLFSPPILELDVYRYLWDGFVSVQGVNPYKYSPSEVLEAYRLGTDPVYLDLIRLASVLDANPIAVELLHLVHFPDLPTVYPPTAQALFAVSAWMTAGASVNLQILVLKAWLVGAELATLLLVWILLKQSRLSESLLLLPAMCPLAVLSVANQGHLDALPALLSVAALTLACQRQSGSATFAAGFFLGLAVGAKLYPLLLTPLLVAFTERRALFSAGVVATVGIWLPWWNADRFDGLKAFAGSWEMNDALFSMLTLAVGSTGAARACWLGFVAVLALWLGFDLRKGATPKQLLRNSFMLLAWFWALGPVCNPWYLMWMLPLAPFASKEGWETLFAVAPAMFVRFGLSAQFEEPGEWWYDHVVVFGLTAAWLAPVCWRSIVSFRFAKRKGDSGGRFC